MTRARLWVFVAYAVALAVAIGVAERLPVEGSLAVALWADIAATVAIFAFSVAFRNSSFYDPYWSVAPLPIAIYWMLRPEVVAVNPIRILLVLLLLGVWGARLTWNWSRGWTGLDHEDWRYVDIAAATGRFYWPASFIGIHMLPTLWVFGGMLPVYVVMTRGAEPFGWLDLLALGVTAASIWLEARADKELVRFRASQPGPEAILRSGVWAWSRHPNYLGEMGLWWGLWLFALAADPSGWWTIVGPIGITLMFVFVSLPMIEKRMAQRRPAYAEYQAASSMVLPRFRGNA